MIPSGIPRKVALLLQPNFRTKKTGDPFEILICSVVASNTQCTELVLNEYY